MSKCRICNVEILDVTEYCPLCHSVLEQTEELENMYPDSRVMMRWLTFFSRIYLFCAIIAEAILFTLDLHTGSEIWWSSITGFILFYIYLIIRFAILGQSGYKSKVITLAVIGILTAIAIDILSGYRGWSVDYVLPAVILLVDAIIIWCMIYNHRNWQSYMMWQILMVLCSILPPILYRMELEHNEYMVFLPLAVSAALFLGTLIIGDRRARTELKRRFHIK